jgi:hypothetical protein
MLVAAEISALSEGIPDLAALCPTLLVPFRVRSLNNASILWINDRWFTERGLMTLRDAQARRRVHEWLLSEFAITSADEESNQQPDEHPGTAYADRYGTASGTSPHGGSGRVATLGCYQVKGVGKTPLVGSGATWTHSHGMATVREAICEAIFGEVLDAELPYGSVPVIAIIDAGETIAASEDGSFMERRALIVRPAPLRPAHMLRAASFVSSKVGPDFAPGRDAARTYDLIRHVASLSAEARECHRIPQTLLELCQRFAAQSAVANALRLHTGGLLAENISLDGAVMDFGVAQAMGDWSNVQVHAHVPGFGQDIERIVQMAASIRFYAQKAACNEQPWFSVDVSRESLQSSYTEALQVMFGRLWATEVIDRESQKAIRTLMQEYFDAQQRVRRRERWDGKPRTTAGWLYDRLIDAQSPVVTSSDRETALVRRIRAVLVDARSICSDVKVHCWRSATRLLQPRPELDRLLLEKQIKSALEPTGEREISESVTRLIENVVGISRRWWSNLPAEISVTSQRVFSGCSVLEGIDARSRQRVLWVEGIHAPGCLVLGDTILDEATAGKLRPELTARKWHCVIEAPHPIDAIADVLGQAPQKQYAEPPLWW